MRDRIIMRVMPELPDEDSALEFEKQVSEKIRVFGEIKASEIKRYWKIPEWFEIFFLLEPVDGGEAAMNGILLALGNGWKQWRVSEEETCAVWNPEKNAKFTFAEMRWAHVAWTCGPEGVSDK